MLQAILPLLSDIQSLNDYQNNFDLNYIVLHLGSQCDEMVDACTPNPCPLPQICRLQGQLGYRCECPAGRTGADCSQEAEVICMEPRCFGK